MSYSPFQVKKGAVPHRLSAARILLSTAVTRHCKTLKPGKNSLELDATLRPALTMAIS
jgi:hypothetical protein